MSDGRERAAEFEVLVAKAKAQLGDNADLDACETYASLVLARRTLTARMISDPQKGDPEILLRLTDAIRVALPPQDLKVQIEIIGAESTPAESAPTYTEISRAAVERAAGRLNPTAPKTENAPASSLEPPETPQEGGEDKPEPKPEPPTEPFAKARDFGPPADLVQRHEVWRSHVRPNGGGLPDFDQYILRDTPPRSR